MASSPEPEPEPAGSQSPSDFFKSQIKTRTNEPEPEPEDSPSSKAVKIRVTADWDQSWNRELQIGLDMEVQAFREFVAEQLLQRPIDTVRLWIGEQKLTDESATLQSCGLREGAEVLSSVTSDVRPQGEPQPEPEEGTAEQHIPEGVPP